MTKRQAYHYLNKLGGSIILLIISTALNAQTISKEVLDTMPSYSLTQALNHKNPLEIYKLTLKKKKLYDLPEEILEFKNLQELDLSKNKFSHFPKALGSFKYLQKLDISSNKIELIPKELGELIHLKELIANQNQIVALPPEIKNLKELYLLDLWGNDIGVFPQEISELKETLKKLDIRVILMSNKEQKQIKEYLPNTKVHLSKSCNCGF